MNYQDIEVGQYYLINYKDTRYPCDCECHTNPDILHIVACCYDKSYYGTALCFYKMINEDKIEIVYFKIGEYRTLCLFPKSVIKKIDA